MKKLLLFSALSLSICVSCADVVQVSSVDRPDTQAKNVNYVGNREPLQPAAFIKLPMGAIKPQGWIREMLERQGDGLAGNLGEISAWLDKRDNAWFGTGNKWGWEELPYWFRGFIDMAYILEDPELIEEANEWLEAIFASQQEDGWFGPVVDNRHGGRDAWSNMLILFALQHYYEYTSDQRVIELMTRYFRYQLGVPEESFLKSYVEWSRGGDNLYAVHWLYNQTGEPWLLELAEKIHRNTADWGKENAYPNWHNVNIAECFREPAQFWQQTGDLKDLKATYDHFHLVRRIFGQVPGGMFGADENCRLGYIDPRQGTETCGFAEQMTSDGILTRITGDILWADNCEDIMFNSFPAAFMPDMKSLRYFTCPNMVVSDRHDHSPGIQNKGIFMMMNPFSSRCCQHNHAHGIPYYIQNLVMASNDNGLLLNMYNSCDVNALVSDNVPVTLEERTNYPFDENVTVTLAMESSVAFPMYMRIPSWCKDAKVKVNGREMQDVAEAGKYLKIERQWEDGDEIVITLPMELSVRRWQVNKNSASINYGPITFSLEIDEVVTDANGPQNVFWDSAWQPEADSLKWRACEIHPGSPWNYGLELDADDPLGDFTIEKSSFPSDNYPFTHESSPIRLRTGIARQIPEWGLDEYGICDVLPDPDPATLGERQEVTLVPMGASRLRISSFPVL